MRRTGKFFDGTGKRIAQSREVIAQEQGDESSTKTMVSLIHVRGVDETDNLSMARAATLVTSARGSVSV